MARVDPSGSMHETRQSDGVECIELLTAAVVSVESIDDASGKYDLYVVLVKDAQKEYSVRKRYSEFEVLRNACNFEIPDVKFPGNKLKMPWELLQMNAEQLEKRRDELDTFLHAVLAHKTMSIALQRDVLKFLDAFLNLPISPETLLFNIQSGSHSNATASSSTRVVASEPLALKPSAITATVLKLEQECARCGATFTWFGFGTRRHHCRCCWRAFCDNHCCKKAKVFIAPLPVFPPKLFCFGTSLLYLILC